ncbi:MAG TPA: SPOR domain-containing protein, partial [Sphingobacteriaceae bacterium]|nr:SPOR domain-containing protein [Sphingobacteriaceae bacterium]
IDSLIARRIALSKTGSRSGRTSAGFQVQIYLGSDRQSAYDAQNRFKSLYPEINTYISYTEPNYKVQVGDFRNRMDAQRLMSGLKENFSTLLIIPATVNTSQ